MKSSNKNQKQRSSAKATPTVIYGYDRIHILLDHSDWPLPWARLKRECENITQTPANIPYHPRWKVQLDVFQPTIACLVLLDSALTSGVALSINYVEITYDIPAKSSHQANLRRNSFLESAKQHYGRDTVVLDHQIDYFNPRYNGTNRSPRVLVIYADWPSYLLNAKPRVGSTPCTHTEERLSGAAVIESEGIVSLQDLILFDHEAFWNRRLRFFRLPIQKTDLGRMLAVACGDKTNVSGTALRKRADRWTSKHSIWHGSSKTFVMHNALLNNPKLQAKLELLSFSCWLASVLSL